MIEERPPHSFTRCSARSNSNSSLAPLGRFNSWPRPDSIRYAVIAPRAAPSAASFLFLSFTPFTAPIAAPAAAACAASRWLLECPSISPSCDGANLIEREPEFRPACHSRRLHVANVAVDFRARGQINPAARFERLQSLHFELFVFPRVFSAQIIFEFHQELRARYHRVGFQWQASPLSVRLLALRLGRLHGRLSLRLRCFLRKGWCSSQRDRR